jgi:hypothetical protein
MSPNTMPKAIRDPAREALCKCLATKKGIRNNEKQI